MCGIYITNIPFKREEVINKLELIKFRGPDNLGYQQVNDISLGHLRLSILDLDARSNQPYKFENFIIVFNGEIYNFKDIKLELVKLGYSFQTNGDTEVLIKAFTEWGKEVLPKLNGMFAFSIYNTKTKIVFSARDRLGVKPFFYYWKDGKFEICSQLRPLLNSQSKLSTEAISIYLDCGYIPSPYSALENVYKLPPGNYMEINTETGELHIDKYWSLQPVELEDISYNEAKEKLHDILIDAVKIRMRSDVPMGSFLSGGIDSALVTAIASSVSEKPISTFTIGFSDPKFDESKIANKFANIIGTDHKEAICEPHDVLHMLEDFVKVYDEPFADSSALPSLLLNKIAKIDVTVALSGDGGDESFLGYNYFPLIKKADTFMKIPYLIRSKVIAKSKLNYLLGKDYDTFKASFSSLSTDELIIKNFLGFESLQKKNNLDWLKYYESFKYLSKDSVQRAADLNILLWLENDSNTKVDRASMAHSVEVRSPFLDYRIIEYARKLPIEFRMNNVEQKRITKDILSQYIPRSIFELPKKGFSIPRADWIRNELKNDILSKLNERFLERVPNLDISRFQNLMNLHFEGKKDYSFAIWKLYILALWFDEFSF